MRDEQALDILHLDMDCFFVAVEEVDNPKLKGQPVVVGGTSDRGVVASASYEARAFGIHAAMPTVLAQRRCRDLICISPHFERYGDMNRRLLEIIERTTPEYEPIAFDEAFIDVVGAHRLFGESHAIAVALRTQVRAELDLDCSVGVGRNKLIAKLASKAAKPKVRLSEELPRRAVVTPGVGVYVVDPRDEFAFLHTHALRALPGIGPKTTDRLRTLGMTSVADVAAVGRERLRSLFGQHQGNHIADVVNGIDTQAVERQRETRSIGSESTFQRDIFDPDELASRIREFASIVSSRARSHGLSGRTVTLKVRFSDLSTISRAKTPSHPLLSADDVASVAITMLSEIPCERGVRLLGIHLSNFDGSGPDAGEQLSLFGEPSAEATEVPVRRDVELDVARDEIERRFGAGALDPLAVLGRRPKTPGGHL